MLLGTLPVEGQLHRILTLLNNILTREGAVERNMIFRQAVVKMDNSHSWNMAAQKLLCFYGLSTIFELMHHPMTKAEWKRLVKATINVYWESIQEIGS